MGAGTIVDMLREVRRTWRWVWNEVRLPDLIAVCCRPTRTRFRLGKLDDLELESDGSSSSESESNSMGRPLKLRFDVRGAVSSPISCSLSEILSSVDGSLMLADAFSTPLPRTTLVMTLSISCVNSV